MFKIFKKRKEQPNSVLRNQGVIFRYDKRV
jgi:hypothetical protein